MVRFSARTNALTARKETASKMSIESLWQCSITQSSNARSVAVISSTQTFRNTTRMNASLANWSQNAIAVRLTSFNLRVKSTSWSIGVSNAQGSKLDATYASWRLQEASFHITSAWKRWRTWIRKTKPRLNYLNTSWIRWKSKVSRFTMALILIDLLKSSLILISTKDSSESLRTHIAKQVINFTEQPVES